MNGQRCFVFRGKAGNRTPEPPGGKGYGNQLAGYVFDHDLSTVLRVKLRPQGSEP